MFTVKLRRQDAMYLVEAEKIYIYPAGKPDGAEGSTLGQCTNKIRQIVAKLDGKPQVFYVGMDAAQITGDVDLYDYAYIENSNGATTERVYGY